MVAFRLDARLKGRVDPSDVLQDAYLEAWRDLGSYLRRPEIPFFLWLRGIAGNKPRELHRHHLGTRMRDPRREVSIGAGGPSESTSTAIAAGLLGDLTAASELAARRERRMYNDYAELPYEELRPAIAGHPPIPSWGTESFDWRAARERVEAVLQRYGVNLPTSAETSDYERRVVGHAGG